MSLQIWLPLNGNLLNKGCSSLAFSALTTNTVTNTSGKIGSCYGNNSYTAGGVCSDTTISLGQKQSMFCWFKFTSLLNSGLGGALVSQHRHTTNSGMGITIRRVSDSTGYLSVNTGNGSSRTYNTYYGTTLLQANTWYHGGYTYDGSTIRIYVNGVCEKEQAYTGMSVPADYITAFCWSFNTSTGSAVYGNYKLNGYLNDVRVYDHCLSLAEIKELAKGLVCHYKLDEFESSDNLIVNGFGELGSENWHFSDRISTTEIPPNLPEIKASFYNANYTANYIPISQNTTYTISGYIKAMDGTTGKTHPRLQAYDIDKKLIRPWQSAQGFNSNTVTTLRQPLHKGDTVIYATDLSNWSTAEDNYIYAAVFGYANSLGYVYDDLIYTQDTPSFGTSTDKSNIDKTNNTITLLTAFTGEDRPAGTTICQSTDGSSHYYPWGSINVTSITDWVFKTTTFKPYDIPRIKGGCAYVIWSTYGKCYIAGSKLVDNFFNDDRIIDSSGYGYHATKSGNLSISYDSARYNISTNFNNSGYIINSAFNLKSNAFTINLWVNPRTTSKQHFLFGSFSTWPNNGLGVYRDAGSNTRYQCVIRSDGESTYSAKTMTVTLNTWNMLTITYSGTVYTGYVNGEKSFEVTYGANGIVSHYNIMIGNSKYNSTPASENEEARVSDFRLYATCLSADDIKRLYEVSASVSKNGAMLGYEMKEG